MKRLLILIMLVTLVGCIKIVEQPYQVNITYNNETEVIKYINNTIEIPCNSTQANTTLERNCPHSSAYVLTLIRRIDALESNQDECIGDELEYYNETMEDLDECYDDLDERADELYDCEDAMCDHDSAWC